MTDQRGEDRAHLLARNGELRAEVAKLREHFRRDQAMLSLIWDECSARSAGGPKMRDGSYPWSDGANSIRARIRAIMEAA